LEQACRVSQVLKRWGELFSYNCQKEDTERKEARTEQDIKVKYEFDALDV
jgi:hypothetical protein